MAEHIPLSEARANLSELVDDVDRRQEHVVITRNGRAAAVLMSSQEYDALEETLEILQDEDLMASLRQSEKDVRAGRFTSLKKLRRELGLG